VAISSNGQLIAASSAGNKFYFFNRQNLNTVWTHPLQEYPEDLAMSHDGKYVAIGLKSGNILSFDTSTRSIMGDMMFLSEIESVDISSNGDYVVAADHLGNMYLFSNTGMDLVVVITSITGIVIILITAVVVILVKRKRKPKVETE
jgi:WD40 repeat protein